MTDDGIIVLDVWDSVETIDGFFHDRLGAALSNSGMPSATPDMKPVHNLIHGREAHPGVQHVAAVGTSEDVSVFDLWDSAEAFGAFAQGQAAPAIGDNPPLQPRIIPVYNSLRRAAS